ncbi:MAG TPA: chaperonin GroEL [Planctomycetota bacterium]|nr:chaperonin GroEL [Planctomycetota bacterium]
MAKQLMFSDEARQKVLKGVEQLKKVVAVTMGPAGRFVAYEKSFGSPGVINDGVTVAKEVDLADPFENMGAHLVRQAAQKTNDVAGDGTTTATVLSHAIYAAGLKAVSAGHNPMALQRGLQAALDAVVEDLKAQSKPCKKDTDLRAVATISANSAQLGGYIADALLKVGPDGVITIEEGKTAETVLEVVEGMQFDRGYLSPYFVNVPAEMKVVMENPLILIYEKKISNLRELIPLLEKANAQGRPLLIIAEEVENEALTTLVINKLRGVLNVCAVKAPGFGDRRKAMLGDLAVLTGGKAITEDLGLSLENVEVADLGSAKKISIDKDNTTIVEGQGKKADIKSREESIRRQIETTTSDYDKEKLQERLAKLCGGVAVIRVGASTETEMKERKARLDDAMHAARAASEEGVVPGGGVAYIRALPAVEKVIKKLSNEEEQAGAKILLKALEAPLAQIAENVGEGGNVVVNTVKESKGALGFNAVTKQYTDLVKEGVIDSTKVVRSALQNAVSIAGLMLTLETMVTDLDKEKPVAVAGAVK